MRDGTSPGRMGAMFVKDWMTRQLITVEPGTPLVEAAQRMARHRIRRLPVVDSGGLVGILSDRDVRASIPEDVSRVEQCMAREVVTVTPVTALEEAAAQLVLNKIGGLPVVENGALVGIITETDIFRGMIHMMGYSRPGIRVEVDVPHEVPISQMLALLEKEPAKLTSFVAGPDQGPDHHHRCAFRLDSLDPELPGRLEGHLRQLHIKVLDIRRSG